MFDFNGNGESDAFDIAVTMAILDEKEEKTEADFTNDFDDDDE